MLLSSGDTSILVLLNRCRDLRVLRSASLCDLNSHRSDPPVSQHLIIYSASSGRCGICPSHQEHSRVGRSTRRSSAAPQDSSRTSPHPTSLLPQANKRRPFFKGPRRVDVQNLPTEPQDPCAARRHIDRSRQSLPTQVQHQFTLAFVSCHAPCFQRLIQHLNRLIQHSTNSSAPSLSSHTSLRKTSSGESHQTDVSFFAIQYDGPQLSRQVLQVPEPCSNGSLKSFRELLRRFGRAHEVPKTRQGFNNSLRVPGTHVENGDVFLFHQLNIHPKTILRRSANAWLMSSRSLMCANPAARSRSPVAPCTSSLLRPQRSFRNQAQKK